MGSRCSQKVTSVPPLLIWYVFRYTKQYSEFIEVNICKSSVLLVYRCARNLQK